MLRHKFAIATQVSLCNLNLMGEGGEHEKGTE